MHLLLFLNSVSKIDNSIEVDKFISAGILDGISNPKLFAIVYRFMTHGPGRNDI